MTGLNTRKGNYIYKLTISLGKIKEEHKLIVKSCGRKNIVVSPAEYPDFEGREIRLERINCNRRNCEKWGIRKVDPLSGELYCDEYELTVLRGVFK